MKKQNRNIIIIFFIIIVCTGFYFLRSKNVTKVIKNQDRSQEAADSNNTSSKETGKEHEANVVNSENPVAEGQITKTKSGHQKRWEFLNREFFYITDDSTNPKLLKLLDSKRLWISNYISNNEDWYRSDFREELSDSKFTIFLNFYNCKKLNSKTNKPFKCYTINIFNFMNDNWSRTNTFEIEESLRWRNETAYALIFLNDLRDFITHNNLYILMLPLPRESMPVYYAKGEGEKMSFLKGQDSDWVLSSQKEFEKFQKWTQGYKVKHGETPEP